MKKNIGKNDRMVRFVVALVLAVLYFMGTVGVWGLIIAVIMGVTAALNFCPLYLPFKLKTK